MLIVLAAALLASQVIGIVIYQEDHASFEREVEGADLQRRIELVRKAIAAAPPAERDIIIRALRAPDFNIQIAPSPAISDFLQQHAQDLRIRLHEHIREAQQQMQQRIDEARDQLAEANRRVMEARQEAMSERDPESRAADLEEVKNAQADAAEAEREIERLTRQMAEKMVRLSMALPNDQVLQVTAAPIKASFDYARFLAIFCATAFMILLIGWWATSRVTRPLALFGAAAERLGRNVDAPPMPEDGPDEVRKAAAAFNRMQERIKRFVADRTTMLAAISHDLRTPLTRMRLRAEFVADEEDRAKLIADIDEMEAMIAGSLSFASDEAEAEAVTTVDLQALAEAVVHDEQAVGGQASIREGGPADVLGRPVALKRALSNLVRNAIAYGGSAEVALEPEPDGYVICVRDRGPGISEADLDRVFTPFLRLEDSRNKSSGGVGLGLSIARSTARAHGGDIRLVNRAEGGLEARLILPAAPDLSHV